MARWALVVCGLGYLAACTGCGSGQPKRHEVTGTVVYKGSPVSGAVVAFHPQGGGQTATGTTDAQGRFTLKTGAMGAGTVAGKHKVTVTKSSLEGGASGPVSMEDAAKAAQGGTGPVEERQLLPAKYADPGTTPIEQTVDASGKNDFQIELQD